MTFPRDFSKLTTNLHQITLKILLTNLHQIIDINREERGKRRGEGEGCIRGRGLLAAVASPPCVGDASGEVAVPVVGPAPAPASAPAGCFRRKAVGEVTCSEVVGKASGPYWLLRLPAPARRPPAATRRPLAPPSSEQPLLVASAAARRHLVGRPRKTLSVALFDATRRHLVGRSHLSMIRESRSSI